MVNRTLHPVPKHSGKRCRARRRGFTLLELTFVVATVMIFSAIAVPRYADALARYRCDAAARRVAADLAWAQALARAAGGGQTVRFDASADRYALVGVTDPHHPGRPYVVDLAGEPYGARVELVALGTDKLAQDVTFDGYGQPDNAGTVVVRAGDFHKTVSLDAATGKATVQ